MELPMTKIAVLKEKFAGENRVAAVPDTIKKMISAGMEVAVEAGAGESSGFQNEEYVNAGAKLLSEAPTALEGIQAALKVRKPTLKELERLSEGCILIASSLQTDNDSEFSKMLAAKKITGFSLDLLPRIARAQNMDILSSMANIAGYKSVLIAANRLPKFFPMLMTAAGTITPARVLILGAGVAGLQAIATARRLGAICRVFDVRPAVKEQVESLGAQFVNIPIQHEATEDSRGYAKEISVETARQERELIARELKTADVCITTAQIPGKKAPILITEEMVKEMRKGSIIVDLAAEQGGNCVLTEAAKEVVKYGITIIGFTDLVSQMAYQSSQIYARNILNFLFHIQKKGVTELDREDEIIRSTLVCHGGEMLLGPPTYSPQAGTPHGEGKNTEAITHGR